MPQRAWKHEDWGMLFLNHWNAWSSLSVSGERTTWCVNVVIPAGIISRRTVDLTAGGGFRCYSTRLGNHIRHLQSDGKATGYRDSFLPSSAITGCLETSSYLPLAHDRSSKSSKRPPHHQHPAAVVTERDNP